MWIYLEYYPLLIEKQTQCSALDLFIRKWAGLGKTINYYICICIYEKKSQYLGLSANICSKFSLIEDSLFLICKNITHILLIQCFTVSFYHKLKVLFDRTVIMMINRMLPSGTPGKRTLHFVILTFCVYLRSYRNPSQKICFALQLNYD